MLYASRHMPVFDPHEVSFAFVHEALTATGRQQYTAAMAVHHYFQLFTSRSSDDLEWSADGAEPIPYCEDSSVAPMSSVVYELLEDLREADLNAGIFPVPRT